MKLFTPKVLGRVVIAGALGLGACNDLDEYNPSNATAENVWTTPAGFVTLVNSAYSEQRNWYGKEDGVFMAETGTDLWYNKNKAAYSPQISQYLNFTGETGNFNRSAWTLLWKSINLCNAGINRINQAGFTDVAERNRREGELRFLRAFYYWHLVETYGGVMLRTQETTAPVVTASRSSVPEFYNVIIEDLKFAELNLPATWGNEYSRATKKAAMGFLARAYLSRAYYGNENQYFTLARDKAKEVIQNKAALLTDLRANYADLWTQANNKSLGRDGGEALYVVSNSTNPLLNMDGANPTTSGNRLYQVYQAPYNGRPGLAQSVAYGYENNGRLMPTRTLLDLYDHVRDNRYDGSFQEVWLANTTYTWTAADVATYQKDPSLVGRRINVGDTALVATKRVIPNKRTKNYVVFDRTDTYNADGGIKTSNVLSYANLKKFWDTSRSGPAVTIGTNDVVVMRLAEMYLIAAEAQNKLGNNSDAADLINVLRVRAAKKTPVDYSQAMRITASDVTPDFILDERAREFAGEYMRWFDVKRVKNTNNFASYIKARNPDITLVQDYHRLRPIRIEELNALLNGSEFGQNPGY